MSHINIPENNFKTGEKKRSPLNYYKKYIGNVLHIPKTMGLFLWKNRERHLTLYLDWSVKEHMYEYIT